MAQSPLPPCRAAQGPAELNAKLNTKLHGDRHFDPKLYPTHAACQAARAKSCACPAACQAARVKLRAKLAAASTRPTRSSLLAVPTEAMPNALQQLPVFAPLQGVSTWPSDYVHGRAHAGVVDAERERGVADWPWPRVRDALAARTLPRYDRFLESAALCASLGCLFAEGTTPIRTRTTTRAWTLHSPWIPFATLRVADFR